MRTKGIRIELKENEKYFQLYESTLNTSDYNFINLNLKYQLKDNQIGSDSAGSIFIYKENGNISIQLKENIKYSWNYIDIHSEYLNTVFYSSLAELNDEFFEVHKFQNSIHGSFDV